MPASSPTPRDAHIDQLLTNISIKYMNEATAFVADKVFPVVPVRKQSDRFVKYHKGAFFRNVAQKRAPATVSVGSVYSYDTSPTYFCENYATHTLVSDELRANSDHPLDPDRDAAELVTQWLLIAREVNFASTFFTAGVWDNELTGVATAPGAGQFIYWSDYANSDPIIDVENARDNAYNTTAIELDQMLVSRSVWVKLKHHPDLIERIKYTQRGVLTVNLVAELLDLQRLHVAKAIQVTSKPGDADTFAPVFGKHALLFFAPDRPSLNRPSAGYTFTWTAVGGLTYIRRLRDEKARADFIEGNTYFDQKVVSSDCGVFFNGAIA